MHILDDAQQLVPEAVTKHPAASLSQYAGLQRRLGTSRFVIVQPSVYGLDNRILVSSLRVAGPQARGVAVMNDQVTTPALDELALAGVRGARFNLVQRGATTVAMLAPVARKVASLGWHLQVHARPAELLELEDRLAALPVDVVLDHIACVGEDPGLLPAVEGCLRRLLGGGKTWLKLSAPYFSGQDAASRERLASVVATLIQRHADRLLWASDWPHATESLKPDDADLFDFLLVTASARQSQQILVDNPARLYGFDDRETRAEHGTQT